jgi:hypothetical protein
MELAVARGPSATVGKVNGPPCSLPLRSSICGRILLSEQLLLNERTLNGTRCHRRSRGTLVNAHGETSRYKRRLTRKVYGTTRACGMTNGDTVRGIDLWTTVARTSPRIRGINSRLPCTGAERQHGFGAQRLDGGGTRRVAVTRLANVPTHQRQLSACRSNTNFQKDVLRYLIVARGFGLCYAHGPRASMPDGIQKLCRPLFSASMPSSLLPCSTISPRGLDDVALLTKVAAREDRRRAGRRPGAQRPAGRRHQPNRELPVVWAWPWNPPSTRPSWSAPPCQRPGSLGGDSPAHDRRRHSLLRGIRRSLCTSCFHSKTEDAAHDAELSRRAPTPRPT